MHSIPKGTPLIFKCVTRPDHSEVPLITKRLTAAVQTKYTTPSKKGSFKLFSPYKSKSIIVTLYDYNAAIYMKENK